MPLSLQHAGVSDVGLARSHNEDAILLLPDRRAFVICDGMGGHASGAVAAQLAIATIAESLSVDAEAGIEPMVGAILAANRAVLGRAKVDPDCHGMGTTVVGLRFDDDQVHVCHVGDSRIYRLRAGGLQPVTRDHSLINLYLDNPELVGKLGPAHSNVIVRAVGLHEHVEVEHTVLPLVHDDTFLLCSDGLVDMAEDWIVREILTSGEDVETVAASLIRVANANGGVDNVSVILVRASL